MGGIRHLVSVSVSSWVIQRLWITAQMFLLGLRQERGECPKEVGAHVRARRVGFIFRIVTKQFMGALSGLSRGLCNRETVWKPRLLFGSPKVSFGKRLAGIREQGEEQAVSRILSLLPMSECEARLRRANDAKRWQDGGAQICCWVGQPHSYQTFPG